MILIWNNLFTTKGGVINNSDSCTVQCKTKSKVNRLHTINAYRGQEAELLSFLTLEPVAAGGRIHAPATSLP